MLKKFTQNNVERKVNEFVKEHEMKLKLKALRGSYKTAKLGRKGQVSHSPRPKMLNFSVSSLLAPREHFTSTEG